MDVSRYTRGGTEAAEDESDRGGTARLPDELGGTAQPAYRRSSCRALGAWIFAGVVVTGRQQAAFAALIAAEAEGRLYIYDEAPPWQAWRVCEWVQVGTSGGRAARRLSLRLWASEWEEAAFGRTHHSALRVGRHVRSEP